MSEKKEKVEVKKPEKRAVVQWRPIDVFHTLDEIWADFSRDLLRTWRLGGRPWRRGVKPSMILPKAACIDFIDTGKEYQVCAEVPGIPKDKIDITITKDGIEISGKADVEHQEEDKGYMVRERSYSEVYRQLAFPEEVVPDEAEATLKQGLLEIKVPKKTPTPEVKKHKVEIK